MPIEFILSRPSEIALAIGLGLATGSFIGLLADRLPQGRPVLVARSKCDLCAKSLGLLDLLPVVTWLARRGRCACGRATLRIYYPLTEVAGALVALSAVPFVSGGLLAATLVLGWILLTLALIDARHLILPDVLTLPLIPLGLLVTALLAPERLLDHALAAVFGFGLFAGLALGYRHLRGREGLGLGDAKLLAAAGAWVGLQGLPSVILISALGALGLALAMRFRGAKLTAESRIAFGPWLAASFWLVWLLGPVQPA